MQRFGWIVLGLLIGILISNLHSTGVIRSYGDQVAGFRDELGKLKKFQGSSADDVGEQTKFVSLVDEKTGKLKYAALDPKFRDTFWRTYGEVGEIRRALGSYGYQKGGEPNPITFDIARAFDAKMHSAKFELQSGHQEAARALLLSALTEADIDIYSCGKPPATRSFHESELPPELLPLLAGSPYTAVSYVKDTIGTEKFVEVGVGKNSYIKGC